MLQVELFIQHYAEIFLKDFHLTDPHIRLALQLIGLTYLIFSTKSIKAMLRTQERRIKAAIPQIKEDDHFVKIYPEEIEHFRVIGGQYDVPKTFPAEYDKYVGAPTMAQMAQWILELEQLDTKPLLDAKRVITAAAAIHGVRIPKILRVIDDGTKAFWVRLSFDLELKEITEIAAKANAAIYRAQPEMYPAVDATTLALYRRELPRVGELILQFSEKGAFPCFSAFLRILTEQHDLSRVDILTPSAVQSLATTYAAKSGFKIPASYLCCDQLTYQLLTSKAEQ